MKSPLLSTVKTGIWACVCMCLEEGCRPNTNHQHPSSRWTYLTICLFFLELIRGKAGDAECRGVQTTAGIMVSQTTTFTLSARVTETTLLSPLLSFYPLDRLEILSVRTNIQSTRVSYSSVLFCHFICDKIWMIDLYDKIMIILLTLYVFARIYVNFIFSVFCICKIKTIP